MRAYGCVLFGAVLVPASVWAAPGQGTVEDPIVIDAHPYFAAGTTEGATSAITTYDCAAGLDESGGEVVYRFELAAAARVTAWVEGDDGVVDVDVHLLDTLSVQDGAATGCTARANQIAEAELGPGEHFLVVDTFDGDAQAGPFVLRTYAIGEAWTEIPVGNGVGWRSRRFMDVDGPQVLNAVDIDPSVAGVSLEVVDANGCQTVSQIADAHPLRPVAAVNSSFFSFDGVCTPVSFMKHAGTVLSYDAGPVLGLTEDLVPGVSTLPADTDWPEVSEAQGGVGMLVQDGVATQGDAAWNAQGISSASFIGPNPRTFGGYRADGTLVLGTADGRRPNAAGESLDGMATWAEELECEGAVNWDGGGSSTMWVDTMTPSGVVNYPSDGGMTEAMDHAGSRALGGAVLVHADPYNWAPRFQTEPVVDAAAGDAYTYDVDAIDLDVDDVVTYELLAAPDGMTIDGATGEIALAPTVESPPEADVTILATDGHGGDSEQSFTLTIEGGMGSGTDTSGGATGDPETAGDEVGGSPSGPETTGPPPPLGDTDTDADAPAARNGGCGCRHRGTPPPLLLLLLVLAVRRSTSGSAASD